MLVPAELVGFNEETAASTESTDIQQLSSNILAVSVHALVSGQAGWGALVIEDTEGGRAKRWLIEEVNGLWVRFFQNQSSEIVCAQVAPEQFFAAQWNIKNGWHSQMAAATYNTREGRMFVAWSS